MEDNIGDPNGTPNPSDAAEQTPQPDPVQNLKSEFSRKFDNIVQQNQELNARLEAILGQIKPSSSQPEKPLKELMYEDPDAAIQVIEQRVESRVAKKVDLNQATQSAILNMSAQFPEFKEDGSAAQKLVIDKFNNLRQDLKGTPEGAQLAMSQAAMELGLIPASRRQKANASDDFSVSSGKGGGSSSGNAPTKKQKSTVAPETIAFAQLMGMNPEDPKLLERLESHAKRDYRRYR